MMPSYRAQLLVGLTVFVLAFASLHAYFDAAGLCGLGGCPEPSISSHEVDGEVYSAACLAAVLAAALAVGARASSFGRCGAARHHRPTEMYLSPETPPPRGLFGS